MSGGHFVDHFVGDSVGHLVHDRVHDSTGSEFTPLWGAQTTSSLHFFAIGEQRMPIALIHALAHMKWAAARVNLDLGHLEALKAHAIAEAALRVAAGDFDAHFPLSAWQTGSGTQSHMNMNEVLATLASASLQQTGSTLRVHPNDDVNLGQSSNDVDQGVEGHRLGAGIGLCTGLSVGK